MDNATVSRKTDVLGREAGKSITHGSTKISEEQIAYLKFGDRATTLPSTVRYATPENGRFAFRDSLRYRYSENGQITGIFANGLLSDRYEYDAAGHLVREDNTAFGKTTTWVYDSNGNRIAERVYPLTDKPTEELHTLIATETVYAYDGDKLLNRGNESITYDTVGNPTSYRGHALTWAFGRRLTAFGSTAFTYDARGRRTGKGDLTFLYDESGALLSQSNGLSFLYDHTGLFAIKDGNTVYYCRKDPQGNILALLDKDGQKVVKYVYDAWGHCKVCNPDGTENTDAAFIGNKNPFRYRGYYFDAETGLYFLQTRYYDPDTGRFLSPDDFSYIDPDTVGGINLYAYCNGDPVDYSDPTGQFVLTALAILKAVAISAAIGAAIGLGTAMFQDYMEDKVLFNGDWTDYLGKIVGGLIAGIGTGLVGALGGGLGVAMAAGEQLVLVGKIALSTTAVLNMATVISFASGALGCLVRESISRKEMLSLKDVLLEGAFSVASNAFGFVAGFCGGVTGAKIPGVKSPPKDKFLFFLYSLWFGVYVTKSGLAAIKHFLKGYLHGQSE